jgi:hypothetical protein
MLAYVFWHWRQPSVDASIYETDLINFTRLCSQTDQQGLSLSRVLDRKRSVAGIDSAAYEEWYLLEDSAAMDRINHAAVHGPAKNL